MATVYRPYWIQVHVCEQLSRGPGQRDLLPTDGGAARAGQCLHTGGAGRVLRRAGPEGLQVGLAVVVFQIFSGHIYTNHLIAHHL